MSRWLATPALLLSLAGCGSVLAPAEPARSRSEEVARLEELILELQRQARMSEVEISRLRRQVAELEARIESGGESPARRPPSVDLPSRPAEVPPEDRDALETRPVERRRLEGEELETSPAPREMPSESPAPPSVAAGSQPLTPQGQELYDRGYTLYHQGRYVDAETTFQAFLQRHGATDLADNAQFWIGEARYRRGDYRGALAAFRETVERYPEANKVPDALFKAGDCLLEIGDGEGARIAWQEVRSRFPSSAAAILAEERLAELP